MDNSVIIKEERLSSEEYIDFLEDKDYKDVVDELVTKHGNHGRIWVVLQEIAL